MACSTLQEIDRLLKLSQSLRMQKEEAERKADYELSACASRANLQVPVAAF